MKSFLYYLLFFTIGLFFLFKTNPIFLSTLISNLELIIHPPCSQPIDYKLGTIDSKFDISQKEFLKDADQAAQIWNSAEGKILFRYNPEAKLTINLVFDQRQSLISQVQSLEDQLKIDKNNLLPTEQKYQEMVADFNRKLADLNSRIEYWNQRGGAPQEEYKNLKNEQEKLKQEALNLNAMAKQLNKSADEYNVSIGQLKDTANNLNEAIQNKPEEGLFDPNSNKIDIYLIVNQDELIHTLAHELGHSLKLQHVSTPRSIMYPYTAKTINPSQDDINALKSVCKG